MRPLTHFCQIPSLLGHSSILPPYVPPPRSISLCRHLSILGTPLHLPWLLIQLNYSPECIPILLTVQQIIGQRNTALDDDTQSVFIDQILHKLIIVNYNITNIPQYDGKINPWAHLRSFYDLFLIATSLMSLIELPLVSSILSPEVCCMLQRFAMQIPRMVLR